MPYVYQAVFPPDTRRALTIIKNIVYYIRNQQDATLAVSFISLWGHPHDGTPSSIQLSHSVHLCLLASNTALFRAPNERESLRTPRLPNPPTNQWQSRLACRNPDKRGQSRLRTFIERSHQVRSTSRRKRLRPTARPRCLVDLAVHHSAEHHT